MFVIGETLYAHPVYTYIHTHTHIYIMCHRAASRIAIIGNYLLRRPKHSTIEVVAPKEEEYMS
jgi:hypothetical protein